MHENDLPTYRSIEVEDLLISPHPSNNSLIGKRKLFARKIASHLEFMEAEFMHNMEWQKKLLNQMFMLESSLGEYKSSIFKQESEKTNTVKLNLNQQQWLREILGAVLGSQHPELSIKELIKQAAAQLKQNKSCSQKYAICSNKEDVAQPLELLVFKGTTQNEFTPSKQIQPNSSPKKLPPRTPKQKTAGNHTKVENQQPFLRPSEYNIQLQSEEVKLDYDEYLGKRLKNIYYLQESLGKRLFQNDNNSLIYMKESSDEENLPDSQISLNLSQSNHDKKKYQETQLFHVTLQCPNTTSRPLQNLYKISHKGSSVKRMDVYEKGNNLSISRLCFAGNPKRKIGKGGVRFQKKFDYGKSCWGKVKEMRDTFGKAYQEYYQQSSFMEGVEEFYEWRKQLMSKSYESQSDWYRLE